MRSLQVALRGLLLAGAVVVAATSQSFACSGITSVTPSSGPATGGTLVTITGSGFNCATLAVTFGGKTAGFTHINDVTLTATTPSGTPGTSVDVTVNIDGTAHTLTGAYTYVAADSSQNMTTLQSNISQQVAATSGQNIGNAVDGGIGAGFSDGGAPSNFGPGGGFINFAADPRPQRLNRAEEAFAALGYAGTPTKAPPLLLREWSAWADIRGTGWKANDTSGSGNDLKGNQINLTAGIGRRLNADTLVGVLVGYEHFKYDVAALAGSIKGDGETVGGYFSRRFGGHLQFDAALAWSNVNYDASSGAATGSFTGSRWLVTSGLTGSHQFGAVAFEPSAKIFVLWERQGAWTDSLGAVQLGRNFSAGRTALGGRIARPFAVSEYWTVAPYAGLYGDWRFASNNALPTGAPVASIKDGWSGRVTAGMSATALRGTVLTVGGELGGLGADYKIWSGNIRGTVPF